MFWKNFKKRKPPKEGWYDCTLSFEVGHDDYGRPIFTSYVMDLWWDPYYERWTDRRREYVFRDYRVFSDATMTQIMHTDELCERTAYVTAWKKCRSPKRSLTRLYQNVVLTERDIRTSKEWLTELAENQADSTAKEVK